MAGPPTKPRRTISGQASSNARRVMDRKSIHGLGIRICRAAGVRRLLIRTAIIVAAIVMTAYFFRPVASATHPLSRKPGRLDAIRRAQVWMPGDVRVKD